ncbi:MAG TPA: hypothetical protein VNH65_06980 [Candidatus Acidoferrum sp.]|nr:hypothetical protein [Candidatus Acidoferrum sp.]
MATKRNKKKKKKQTSSKKVRSRNRRLTKRTSKNTVVAKKAAPKKKARKKQRVRGKSERADRVVFEPKGLGAGSGGQSGDLQGLSNRAGADSESVDELLEEGNAFEAEVVKGVQDVRDADEGEIRTHEVPEDDVPDEYLEKDQ